MRSDEMIKRDIVDQLSWDNRIDAAEISVKVNDGTVTLTGEVQSFRAHDAATSNAWLVDGVRSVDNQLSITYVKTPTLPSDAEIREEILNSFRWHPDLQSYKIDVSVDQGWVTLEGTVDAYWKKLIAASDASSTRGVLDVNNKIAIVPTKSISDELIAEDIVDAIERNVRVSTDDVDVTVSDGEVTLNGTVPNAAAKIAAYDSALYTAGVKYVHDYLTVREPAMALA